jgi:Protein of unknown function (DUF4239)
VNGIAASSIAFATIFGGVFIGAWLRRRLPEHHLGEGTKDIVRLGTGLLGTLSALVLGLLIASANTSYETQSTYVRRLTANLILLDEILAQYGPQTRTGRDLLRRSIGPLVDKIWQRNPADAPTQGPFRASAMAEMAYKSIQELAPTNDTQRSLEGQALQTFTDLAQARLELFARAGTAIPTPFLAMLILWLTIIFASFSLFTRLNPTLVVIMCIFALSASGALYLILELSQPFGGVIQIPSSPLLTLLNHSGRKRVAQWKDLRRWILCDP